MAEKRINPETGVYEEETWLGWTAIKNAEGREERVNPETGVHEEETWLGWTATKNAEGREERVNPDTGVREEETWLGWDASKSAEGREVRVNPDTGVYEEETCLGWTAIKNSEGREMRVNPDTGVYEEETWLGWQPSEESGSGHPRPPCQGPPTTSPSGSRESVSTSYDRDRSTESTGNVRGGTSATSSRGSGATILIVLAIAGIAVAMWGGGFTTCHLPKLGEIGARRPSSGPAEKTTSWTGERYPQTRTDILSIVEVQSLDYAHLRYAINEMFARHGAVFPQPELNNQFRQFQWYHPRPGRTFDQIEMDFSDIEKTNLKLLGAIRDSRKRR